MYDGTEWTNYTVEDGLADNYMHDVTVDGTGAVWIATATGLSRFKPDDAVFVNDVLTYPEAEALMSVRPNPFNPSTTIDITLKSQTAVELSVYNTVGQKIRTLVADTLRPGNHVVRWDGMNSAGDPVSSGVYIARLKTENGVSSCRMTLVR